MPKKISIIVPTYNEKGNILALIEAISNALLNYDYEILIIDDNSPDGTYEAVQLQGNQNVRPILRTSDKGFAKSIRCGLENSVGEIIVVMDSDFNHDPKHIPFMINALTDYDCVFASRFLYGGRGASQSRHLLSWGFNIFLRIITDGKITDNLFGYFALNRRVLESINYDSVFWGFGEYCIRLLYFIQAHEFTILQIPVIIGDRLAGIGNQKRFKVFIEYTLATIQLVLKNGRLKPFQPGAK